jgi:glucose/arabinose dehydrogenase
MRKVICLLAIFLISCTSNQNVEVLVENLEVPWAIAFFKDGSFLFTERETGYVYHYGREAKQIAKVSSAPIGEGGLLGIAIDPNFEQNKFVYLYYTYQRREKTLNRVSRFVYDQVLRDETVLVDEIPGASYHDGGRIEFGPDNLLYITTGDAGEKMLAQDLNSLAGKILRINPDGSIPAGNPYPDSPVYSYGHRNPQGLAWYKGILIAPEHGPDRNDEINMIKPGMNYGWPVVQCTAHQGYQAPIRCFDQWTLAPGGAAFDDKGNLYVAGLRGSQIRKFELRDGELIAEEIFLQELGRLREVKYRDGYLYITTSNQDGRGIPRIGDDKIFRIKV